MMKIQHQPKETNEGSKERKKEDLTKNPGPVIFWDFYGCGGTIMKIMGSTRISGVWWQNFGKK